MNTICIHADGNETIATGHIQRCLSIARAIRNLTDSIISQPKVIFIVSDKKSAGLLKERFEYDDEFPIHILENDYRKLSKETGALFDCASQFGASALLIDSYFVTEEFFSKLHQATQKAGIKLAYLDDQQILSNYDVDVIINYSTVSEPVSYLSVPGKLCGKIYTPLRSQFIGRDFRVRNKVSDLFISSGGTDPYGICLFLSETIKDMNLHILTGSYNRDIQKLRDLSVSKSSITLYEGITDVASVMLKCDIGICAGGTTLGELCAIGMPCVSYIIADNQRSGVMEFEKDGIIPCAGDFTKDPLEMPGILVDNIKKLQSLSASERASISQKMRRYIDGTGASKIAKALLS